MARPAALRADQVPLRCERVSRIEGLLCVLPLALPEGKTRVRASPYGLMVDSVPWDEWTMVTEGLMVDSVPWDEWTMVTEGSCKGSYSGWRAAIVEACFTLLFRPMRVLFQKPRMPGILVREYYMYFQ